MLDLWQWLYKNDLKVRNHCHITGKNRGSAYRDCNINCLISNFKDSFQFLSSSADGLVKNLSKDDFKYFNHEFDNDVLDLVKQKGFHPYKYMKEFENFKEQLPSKEKFYSSLANKKITDKEYGHVLNVWSKFERKTIKDHHHLYLKCDVSLCVRII